MRSDYKVYRYDRLNAPVVTAGSAAVLIGAQNGLFPDMGYAVPGEMGGLWAGEKKICDGFFLAVDDVPLTQATRSSPRSITACRRSGCTSSAASSFPTA